MSAAVECESVRLAAEMGVDVDWFRWMFAPCGCPECERPGASR
jgi:hypothetical protein